MRTYEDVNVENNSLAIFAAEILVFSSFKAAFATYMRPTWVRRLFGFLQADQLEYSTVPCG
jgi:hypothetical protein